MVEVELTQLLSNIHGLWKLELCPFVYVIARSLIHTLLVRVPQFRLQYRERRVV